MNVIQILTLGEFALGFISLLIIKRVIELHHLYWGLILLVAPWNWIQLVGLIIVLDDCIQHTYQAIVLLIKKKKVNDFTPIHWIGVKICLALDLDCP